MHDRDPQTTRPWARPEGAERTSAPQAPPRIARVVLDRQGNLQDLDATAAGLFSGSRSNLIGRPLADLFSDRERSLLQQFMAGLQRGEAMVPLELTCKGDKDGRRLRLEPPARATVEPGWTLTVVEMVQAQGTEEGEARRHLNAIARAARANSLVEMASGLAHELSQPLSAIVAYARAGRYLLQMDTPHAREELERSLEKVGEQAERAADIIRRIRGSVQKDTLLCAGHAVGELLRHALAALEDELRECGIAVRLEEAEPDLQAWVDAIAIEQVLVNLLRNAMDSMVAAESERRAVTVTVARAGEGCVEVSLADTGEGTVGQDPEQWFMPFSTSRRGSLGLSLSLSRSLVEAHGGRLWAEASDNGGTRMRFTLPTAPE